MVEAGRHVLEVGGQHAGRAVDPEEVVRVHIAAIGLRHALGHERYGDDATGAGGHGRTRPLTFEPGLDREGRSVEARRGAERDPLRAAVEAQRVVRG